MLFVYPAIFHKENESYWVEFPDLVGCQTYGSTLNETMEFAQEALAAYVMTLLDDGTDIPAPSELTDISTEKESFVTLVTCDIDQYKNIGAVKKTLSIPLWLNERATAKGINFSKTLQDALLLKIQK